MAHTSPLISCSSYLTSIIIFCTMKLLFTDLDGTLLTDNKDISDVDMAAIHAMIAAGHKFVMTTGRPLTSVKRIAEKYGF